jgi:hypothetical protein
VVLKTSVSMCAPLGNVAAAKGNFSIPNGTVFYDANVKIYAVGTIDETWTIRCVDDGPNSVWVSGAAVGTLTGPNQDGSFPVSGVTTIKPANAFGQSYYFEVPYSCWGGGFLTNQTVTFTTTAAAKGLWVRRLVPAGSSAHLNNSWELAASGDTV